MHGGEKKENKAHTMTTPEFAVNKKWDGSFMRKFAFSELKTKY